MEGEKSFPTRGEGIPDYLYNHGTKKHKAAELICIEGIDDVKTISDRVGMSKGTVYNVKTDVRRIAVKMTGSEVDSGEIPGKLVS